MATEEPKVDEATALNISKSRIRMAGVKPEKRAAAAKKHEKLVEKRTENRIAKKKAKDKQTPVQARKALLEARLRKVQAGTQATNYTNETILSWVKELAYIKESPKTWKPGCMKGGKQPSLKDKVDAVMRAK